MCRKQPRPSAGRAQRAVLPQKQGLSSGAVVHGSCPVLARCSVFPSWKRAQGRCDRLGEPVRAFALENHRSGREVDNAIHNRIETLLRIAAANGAETLVVGPFGCGRNGYDPQQVVALFAQWFEEHPGVIPLVVFSVSRQYFDAFDSAFGAAVEERPAVVEEGDEESEDEEWRSVDLPEGVSLR